MLKNIIFDVGDVLLEYRWKDMLCDYGLEESEAERVGNLMFNDELWHVLDLGIKTDREVIDEYKKKYPKDAEVIEWFITHGEYMHVQRPDVWYRVHLLKKKGYRIYLLSNYSKNLFNKHTRGATFLDEIDGKVVSYEINVAKPDKGIYMYLLNKYSLNPSECIFFDDRLENIKAAEELGIKSIHVTSKEKLIEEINKLI